MVFYGGSMCLCLGEDWRKWRQDIQPSPRQSPDNFLCPARPVWALPNLKAEDQSSQTHLPPVVFCCYHQILFLCNHTHDRRIAGKHFLENVTETTKISRKSVILRSWILECGSLFVIYLDEIKLHWHCFFVVMKWQKWSNIWNTYVFLSSCWKQLLYFYSKVRNLPVCVEMLVFIIREKRLDVNIFRSIPWVLDRQISPKDSFTEPQHTRHLLSVNQNDVIMCLPRCSHKARFSKLNVVQDSQSQDSVGGMAVYTQMITAEIIWGCNYQG